MFTSRTIEQIKTSRHDVYAFCVSENVDHGDVSALIAFMNELFDATEKLVNILMDISGLRPAEVTKFIGDDLWVTHIRSHGKVDRYAIIGAPIPAQMMCSWIDRVAPIDAQTFPTKDAERAWYHVGAHPTGQPAHGGSE